MKISLNLAGLMFLLLGAATVVFTSCGDDDSTGNNSINIDGCTDEYATNFNLLATHDDGSCTFERNAFYGDYLSSLSCNTSPDLEFLNIESISFSIVESLDIVAKKDVLITFTGITFIGLSFRAVVDGSSLNVPETITRDVPLEKLDPAINADITISGDFHLNNNEIVGVISIDAVQENGASLGTYVCDLVAVKQ